MDKRSSYVFDEQQVKDHHLIASFNIGMYTQGKQYKRQVYSILDVMGNIGGLADAVIQIGFLLNFYFAATLAHV